jgi:hypothetical protein
MNKILIILLFISLKGFGQYALPYHFENSAPGNIEELSAVMMLSSTFATNQIYISTEHFTTLSTKHKNQQTFTIYATGVISTVCVYYLVKHVRNNRTKKNKFKFKNR